MILLHLHSFAKLQKKHCKISTKAIKKNNKMTDGLAGKILHTEDSCKLAVIFYSIRKCRYGYCDIIAAIYRILFAFRCLIPTNSAPPKRYNLFCKWRGVSGRSGMIRLRSGLARHEKPGTRIGMMRLNDVTIWIGTMCLCEALQPDTERKRRKRH